MAREITANMICKLNQDLTYLRENWGRAIQAHKEERTRKNLCETHFRKKTSLTYSTLEKLLAYVKINFIAQQREWVWCDRGTTTNMDLVQHVWGKIEEDCTQRTTQAGRCENKHERRNTMRRKTTMNHFSLMFSIKNNRYTRWWSTFEEISRKRAHVETLKINSNMQIWETCKNIWKIKHVEKNIKFGTWKHLFNENTKLWPIVIYDFNLSWSLPKLAFVC